MPINPLLTLEGSQTAKMGCPECRIQGPLGGLFCCLFLPLPLSVAGIFNHHAVHLEILNILIMTIVEDKEISSLEP